MPQFFQNTEIARPSYYDRQPIPIVTVVNQSYAPHVQTLRATYTPPFLNAAFIETCWLRILRNTLATTPGLVALRLVLVPFYGGGGDMDFLTLLTNINNDSNRDIITSLGYMAYGDVLSVYTIDTSVGGNCAYNAAIKGTEFVY